VTPGQGVPYPPPPPPLPPGFSTTPSGSYPPPGAGAAQAQTTRPPFAPHRVRLRRAVALLSAPNPDAPTAAELTAGQPANAVDERDGWYLLEANGATGWAPIEAVEEP
jgi:hypothetical protein